MRIQFFFVYLPLTLIPFLSKKNVFFFCLFKLFAFTPLLFYLLKLFMLPFSSHSIKNFNIISFLKQNQPSVATAWLYKTKKYILFRDDFVGGFLVKRILKYIFFKCGCCVTGCSDETGNIHIACVFLLISLTLNEKGRKMCIWVVKC